MLNISFQKKTLISIIEYIHNNDNINEIDLDIELLVKLYNILLDEKIELILIKDKSNYNNYNNYIDFIYKNKILRTRDVKTAEMIKDLFKNYYINSNKNI